jgi:hypothetical protein
MKSERKWQFGFPLEPFEQQADHLPRYTPYFRDVLRREGMKGKALLFSY